MISIQNFTTYSILSGLAEPKVWAKKAKELGYKALGITEKNHVGSWLEFQKDCLSNEIKPLLGVELNFLRENNKVKTLDGQILLYAKDKTGFDNIIRITNLAHSKVDNGGNFYYIPRTTLATLEEYSEGVVCVVPPLYGPGAGLTDTGRLSKHEILTELHTIFQDDFYVGINPVSEQPKVQLSSQLLLWTNFNPIFTFDSHYPDKSFEQLYKIVRKVDQEGRTSKNLGRMLSNAHLPTSDELLNRLSFIPMTKEQIDKCLDNLDRLANICNAKVQTGINYMPECIVDVGVEEDIIKWANEGFQERLVGPQKGNLKDLLPYELITRGEAPALLKPLSIYREQLDHEIALFKKLGFLAYFHIVYRLCEVCDIEGTARGAGRGSAAGSLLNYLIKITKVDPIFYDLDLSRFINEDRNDLPDIDMDHSAKGREVIYNYIKKNYGEERFLQIGAWERWKVASAIKAIARAYAYGIPDNDDDIIVYDSKGLDKLFKGHVRQTARGIEELEERLENNYDFKLFYEKHSNWVDNIIVPLLETCVNQSVHASGAIIVPHGHVIPCYEHASGTRVTFWRDRNCEEAGYPKLDILGLEACSVIEFARNLIKSRHDFDFPDLSELKIDDPYVMEIFKNANTDGIFQYNTYSLGKYLRALKPEFFLHIVAAVALIRPGPIAMKAPDTFRKVLHGEEEPNFPHLDLKKVLDSTLGIPVYQEQIMAIAKVIASFTGSQADYLRKAIGKKKREEMLKWEEIFKRQGLQNGYSQELLDSLWTMCLEWSEYGFCKAHAVAYALISLEQAYLKAAFPVEYWCSILQHAPKDRKKDSNVYNMRDAAVGNGIKFVYPNIKNFSVDFYPLDDKTIYWPLSTMKGIGSKVCEELERLGVHSFSSIEEMVDMVNPSVFNKGIFDKLIFAGFFNPLMPPWEAAEEYYRIRREKLKKKDDIPAELLKRNPMTYQRLRNTAFDMIVESWKDIAPVSGGTIPIPENVMRRLPDGQVIQIGGIITRLEIRKTKRNNWFAKATIEDAGELHKVMFWSEYWESEHLNFDNARPMTGQIVELRGIKTTFRPEDSDAEYLQVEVGSRDSEVRIVWDEYRLERGE